MSRNRERQSRFGPPSNSYGGSNPTPLMSLKTGMPRSYDESIFSTQNLGPSTPKNYKTPEQLAFDNEFKKWEKSFEDWKRAYANHPDRVAYREYERKFLDVREKLIEKRKQIYIEEPRSGNSSSFANSFDNQLLAADAMACSILSKFSEPKDFRDDEGYRGGYLQDRNISRGNYPAQSSGNIDDNRGNGRNNMERERAMSGRRNDGGMFGGRNDRSMSGGQNDRSMSGGRNDRSMSGGRNDRAISGGRNDNSRFGGRNDKSGGRNDRSGGRNDGFRDDRFGGRNDHGNRGRDNRFGNRNDTNRGRNDRGFDRRMQKPSQEQLIKELNRRDLYPHNRWVLCSKEDRPPLVGKRGKKMNSKIQNVIERKRMIAEEEIPIEELPFSEKIDKMFELAQSMELPKLLSGSMNRRLKNIRKKNEKDLNADERKFLAYFDFVSVKRGKYFEEKKKQEENVESIPME